MAISIYTLGHDNAAMESWNHSFKAEAAHGERPRLKLGYVNPEGFGATKVA